MARAYGDYLRRGALIAVIVIDPPEQNAAMVKKLSLPFPILSDPGGMRATKPYGVWDEAGQMSKPAIVVLDRDGREVYRYVGVDFMDRPHEDEVISALDSLEASSLERAIMTVPHLDPIPGPRAISLTDLSVYLRGVRFSSQALAERARDPWDRNEAERTSRMAERYITALGATRRMIEQPELIGQ